MKTAVVYYTMSENTKYAAEKIAENLGADLIQISPQKAYKDKGFSKFIWGGRSALMGDAPKLMPYQFNAASYDRVILGTPIWASTFAPPLRSFIRENPEISQKEIGAFACCSGGDAGKTFLKLKELLGVTELKAELVLVDPKDKPDPVNESKIQSFCTNFGLSDQKC